MHLPRTPGRPHTLGRGARLAIAATVTLAVAKGPSLPAQATPAHIATTPTQQTLQAAYQAIKIADWTAAEQALRPLLAATPEAPEPHYLLGYVLFRRDRATESLAEYTAGARLRPPTPDDLIVVASDYILLKAYTEAEHWLQDATAQAPRNRFAWYMLGRTQYTLDHAADALASFERCLQLSPNDVRAEYNRGLALERLDRAPEAEAAFQAAIAWQKAAAVRDPQPYLDLGMLLLSQQHADRALAPLREATTLGPNNALAHQELGRALDILRLDTEAIQALQRATELAPDAEQPHFLLGRLYRRLGQNTAAAAQFREVERIAGTHSETETPNVPPA